MSTFGRDLVAHAGRLRAAGAQYIVVQSLRDMGKLPLAAATGQQAQLEWSALTTLFNSTVDAATGAAHLPVIQSGTYLILSAAIESMITGPQQMAMLGEAPNDVERANWRTLDRRMMSAMGATGSAANVQA